jgi:hypothetical protein
MERLAGDKCTGLISVYANNERKKSFIPMTPVLARPHLARAKKREGEGNRKRKIRRERRS